jgi:3-deoxy-D-manno-octulosonate 8-phosphate phosphatase (KDO 8-P phosphatase)
MAPSRREGAQRQGCSNERRRAVPRREWLRPPHCHACAVHLEVGRLPRSQPRPSGLGFALLAQVSPGGKARSAKGAPMSAALDVDGVLTDGRVYVGDDGRELKAFSALDGVGLKMLMRAGITVAWITGSNAPSVMHRARALGVHRIIQGADDKLAPWDALRSELGLPASACAHIGDDLPDVPVFIRCGLAVAVPHAPVSVRARAHWVTGRDGGMGAVRELCELILAAQGVLDPQHATFGA